MITAIYEVTIKTSGKAFCFTSYQLPAVFKVLSAHCDISPEVQRELLNETGCVEHRTFLLRKIQEVAA